MFPAMPLPKTRWGAALDIYLGAGSDATSRVAPGRISRPMTRGCNLQPECCRLHPAGEMSMIAHVPGKAHAQDCLGGCTTYMRRGRYLTTRAHRSGAHQPAHGVRVQPAARMLQAAPGRGNEHGCSCSRLYQSPRLDGGLHYIYAQGPVAYDPGASPRGASAGPWREGAACSQIAAGCTRPGK